MVGEKLNVRSLQSAILRILASVRHQHKFNLLGKGNAEGDLERQLGIRFEPEQRHIAAVALAELEAAGLIRPTYEDLIAPDLWFAITDQGRAVLERGSVDALDEALGRSTEPTQKKELEQKFKILFSASQAVDDFAEWISDEESFGPVAVIFVDIDHFKALNTAHTET
ncbi:MAG TPA: hypothetical protein VN937_23010 [Blastocatellia bacterium]|nr:hypothetical protein [Blastocatellia bacterium]